MKTPAKGTKITYKGKEYTFNGTAWETKLGGNFVEVAPKDELNTQLNNEVLKQTATPKPSPSPGGEVPEGTKVKHSTGVYVFTGGKWMHKSGDGYDFPANPTNAKELNEKVKNGEGEVWDNKKGGYIPLSPALAKVKQAAEGLIGRAGETPLKNVQPMDKRQGGTQGTTQKTTTTTTPLATREQLPTTGITPQKGSLQRTQTPLAPSLGAEFFDRGSAEAQMRGEAGQDLNFFQKNLGGFGGKLGGLAEYLPDVFKATLGLAGANKELPEFEVPSYFTDYQRRMQELSQQGLTAEELGTGMRNAERAYAYDVNNIERFSGGRPGVALSNLGRATTSYQDALGDINLADAQMRRQNLGQYGNVLGQRLNLDQGIFNTKYNEAMQSKMAGAQLAADALSQIDERQQYNKFYGDNSTYGKYMQSLQEGQEYQNQIYQHQLQNPGVLPEFNPSTVNPNAMIPQYFNQYYGQPQQ